MIGDQIRAHRQGLVERGFDAHRREAVVVVFGFCAATNDEARSLGAPAVARSLQRMGRPGTDPDDVYDKLVEVGLAVLGDRAQAAALMQGFAEQGVDRMAFLNAFGALPVEDNAESIRLLAKAALNVILNPASPAANPDRDWPLLGQRIKLGMAHLAPTPFKGHQGLGPQRPHQINLLFTALPTIMKILIQGIKLHRVPPHPNPQPEAAIAHQIHLGRLLRHQSRLALRHNENTGHQLQRRRAGRQVAQ